MTAATVSAAGPSFTAVPTGSAAFVANPTYRPVDYQLVSVPIGSFASGFVEYGQRLIDFAPAPYYRADPNFDRVPDQPNPNSPAAELGLRVTALGLQSKGSFTSAELSAPKGLIGMFMLVPTAAAPTGSSPDFANGPIIPNSTTTFTVSVRVTRDGVEVDSGGSLLPGVDDFTPPRTEAGQSRIPVFYATNSEFIAAPLPGLYQEQTTLVDQQGNGFVATATFTVIPEPTSLATAGGIAMLVVRRRRPTLA